MARQRIHRRKVGDKFSEGARLTWEALDQRSWDQATLTEKLGAAEGMVNRWMWGDRRPTALWITKLQDLLEVPAVTWGQKPTVKFRPVVLAA